MIDFYANIDDTYSSFLFLSISSIAINTSNSQRKNVD